MNFKTTYILFGALLLMVGVLLASLYYHGKAAEKDPDRLFPHASSKDKEKSFPADDVTRVVIQRKKPAGEDIVLEKDGKSWKITSPRALAAEGHRVTGLIGSILEARPDEPNRPRSTKEGELDSPTRVVTLFGQDDKKATLTIGAVEPGSEATAAVMTSGQPNRPLAVKKRHIEAALEDVAYFRAKELLGEDTNDVVTIKVTDAKKGTVELAKEGEKWRFVQPSYGEAGLDQAWLQNISGLRVEYRSEKENDFVKEGVTDLDTVEKELSKSEQLRIEVGRGEDAKKAKKTALVVLTAKKAGDKYYAYVDDGGKAKDVVKLGVKSVEPFVKLVEDPSSLRSKNLLALEAGQKPDAIDVQNNERTDGLLEFRKPEADKSWTLYRGATAVPTDEQEVRVLLSELTRPNAITSFPDPKRKKELGLESPTAVVKVWADSLDRPDPKKGGKPEFKKDAKAATELRIGKTEGANVAVERVWGKDSVIVMVPESLLTQLRKRPLAYYERSLPPFSPGALPDEGVTKVEFTRDGELVELTRDKPTAPWTIVKPAAQKGRTASEPTVREVLDAVNRPVVREIAAEKVGPAELGQYGLKNPKSRVVVTVTKGEGKDAKETKHEYDFGSEAGKDGVYLKVSGKDAVYVVEGRSLAAVKRELRDTTVFNFDADKVTSVKLTGWLKREKEVTTRTLEKKDGKWVIKEKSNLTVDEPKVKQALEGLAHLSAERFVPSGKGLDLKEDALKVEVTLDDKKTVELTVGAEDGAGHYFATSDQLKGEVFLVNDSLFRSLKDSPLSFVK